MPQNKLSIYVSHRIFVSIIAIGISSAIYINEEANDVVQAILKHYDENPQDSRFEQVIYIPLDKCHLFPKVTISGDCFNVWKCLG